MTSLRFTETNSADDSKGRTWGLEGNLFWYLAGSAFTAVVILLVMFSVLKVSFLFSVIVAAVPLVLTMAYVILFRQGKPPGYDRDCFDLWINGAGFGPEPNNQPRHPLDHV